MLAILFLTLPPVADVPPVIGPPPVVVKSDWDAKVVDVVEAGGEVWVSVGEDYPGAIRMDECEPGLGKGVFKFWKQDGKRVMGKVVREVVRAAENRSLFPVFNPPVLPGLFPAGGS